MDEGSVRNLYILLGNIINRTLFGGFDFQGWRVHVSIVKSKAETVLVTEFILSMYSRIVLVKVIVTFHDGLSIKDYQTEKS